MKADKCIQSIDIFRLYNRFEKIQQNTTDCKISVQIRSRLHQGSSRTFTDKPGELVTIPVVPMVDTEPNRVPPFEESQAILSVPIVRLVPHPIVPCNLSPSMIPGPVAVVVVAVRTVHCGSNPPLVVILHAGNLRHMGIHCTDQRLDQVVLLRTSALVHINEPSFVESANGLSVRLCHSLVHSTQQYALNLIPYITNVPAIRTGIGVLC